MALNKTFLGYSIVILILGLVMMITSAMGNECEKYEKDNEVIHNWMTAVLGVSVLLVLISFSGFYLAFSGTPAIMPVGPVSTQLNPLNNAVIPDIVNSVINKAGTQ